MSRTRSGKVLSSASTPLEAVKVQTLDEALAAEAGAPEAPAVTLPAVIRSEEDVGRAALQVGQAVIDRNLPPEAAKVVLQALGLAAQQHTARRKRQLDARVLQQMAGGESLALPQSPFMRVQQTTLELGTRALGQEGRGAGAGAGAVALPPPPIRVLKAEES